jgi:hypothetical protein
VEPVRRFLKIYQPSPENVGELTFANPSSDLGDLGIEVSGSVPLVTLVPRVLRPGAAPEYAVGPGYRATVPVFDVPGVKSWQFAQFDTIEPTDSLQVPAEITDVRARLHDGLTEYVWGGSSWDPVADPDVDWNTLAEVSTNLPSWDPSVQLGFVFELSTTDKRYTPALEGFRVLYEIDLPSELNDWIFGTLITDLRAIRPTKDLHVVSDGTTSIAFGVVVSKLEDGWEFRDVVGVFADQYRRTNLLQSYDSGTKTITLSSAPATSTVLTIRVEYAPQVAVTTDPDFIETAASPAIAFDTIDVIDHGEASQDDGIVNRFVDPPTAVILPARRHVDIDITATITAPLTVDLHRLIENVDAWFAERRVVRSHMTGELATLRISDPLDAPQDVPRSGLRSATMRFRLENVYLAHRAPVDGAGVKQLQVTVNAGAGSVDFSIDGG